MAKITLNGVDALTESGGVVTIPGAANLNLGTNAVPSAAIQDDAVTSAKLDTNIAVAGTLGVTGTTTLAATTINGNLTVSGATTTTVSETLQVEDKNIEMGTAGTPSDATADGGGLTLKGTTDKTILWENDTDSWNFSEHVETANNKKIKSKGEAIMHSLHRSWVLGG